jgi:hypothetical protein
VLQLVLGFVDEQPRKVVMELGDPEYHVAVQAHDNQNTVLCVGLLVREGRFFALKNPHSLEIEETS